MTRDDVAAVLALIRMTWPHSNIGDNADQIIGLWHSFLAPLDRQDVEEAVRELVATGREYAPPVGVVVKTVADRQVDAPGWDAAWHEIQTLIRRNGSYRVPAQDDFSHAAVAQFAIPAWEELCMAPAPGVNGHSTHYAQQRDAYQARAARAARDTGLAVVGATRKAGLTRPDYLKALPGGGAA